MNIDPKLFNLVQELKSVLNDQQAQARKHLEAMPEGEQKEQLKALLKQAGSGNMKLEDVQNQLKKILSDAG